MSMLRGGGGGRARAASAAMDANSLPWLSSCSPVTSVQWLGKVLDTKAGVMPAVTCTPPRAIASKLGVAARPVVR